MIQRMIYVIVQAERKIPMNYANRYRNSALAQQSYLPFKACTWRPTQANKIIVAETS